MLYLVSTKLRKALELRQASKRSLGWKELMLLPHDFDAKSLHDPLTRSLMAKISFEHGGEEYDAKYPDGIPTSMVITDEQSTEFDSGLVMYPGGHARNNLGDDQVDIKDILAHKFEKLGALAFDNPDSVIKQISNLEKKKAREVAQLYNFPLTVKGKFD